MRRRPKGTPSRSNWLCLLAAWLFISQLLVLSLRASSVVAEYSEDVCSNANIEDNEGDALEKTCSSAPKIDTNSENEAYAKLHPSQDRFLQPECGTTHSQTALALKMAQTSSPRGSSSYQKLQRILSDFRNFYIDLGGSQKLFDVVTDNMVTALEGYGLQHIFSPMDSPSTASTLNDGDIHDHHDGQYWIKVETLFSKSRKDPSSGTFYMDLPNSAIIIVQTEQICCSQYGTYALGYFHKCHQSPKCIIWEYSHLNYQWLVDQGLGDSVVLLPTLHQHRLDPYYGYNHNGDKNERGVEETSREQDKTSGDKNEKTESISDEREDSSIVLPSPPTINSHAVLEPDQRTIDVVFFGVMTPRRKQIHAQLQQIALQQNWNMIFQEVENSGSRLEYMADHYQRSKICLIVHSFVGSGTGGGDNSAAGSKSPGEYHRLSEMAPSGCLPVVETFGDELGIDEYYRQCGGVVFSDLAYIPSVIQTLLTTNYDNVDKMYGRVTWWHSHKIDWENVLALFLDD